MTLTQVDQNVGWGDHSFSTACGRSKRSWPDRVKNLPQLPLVEKRFYGLSYNLIKGILCLLSNWESINSNS